MTNERNEEKKKSYENEAFSGDDDKVSNSSQHAEYE